MKNNLAKYLKIKSLMSSFSFFFIYKDVFLNNYLSEMVKQFVILFFSSFFL